MAQIHVDWIRNPESEPDSTDVALRYCPSADSPRHAIMLLQENMSPVPSPDLMVRIGPRKKTIDLAKTALLIQDHNDANDPVQSWEGWCPILGVQVPADIRSISFDFTCDTVGAAVPGKGGPPP